MPQAAGHGGGKSEAGRLGDPGQEDHGHAGTEVQYLPSDMKRCAGQLMGDLPLERSSTELLAWSCINMDLFVP